MSIVKLNNRAIKDATAVGSTTQLGNLVFISKQTASSSASVSFTSGIDSTYKEYIFFFYNMHPATDGANVTFNLSTDGGSNYNVTKTTTSFNAYHGESDSPSGLGYDTGDDLAQSTNYQTIATAIGSDDDQNTSGYLHLFDPSNDTFVKHFIAKSNVSNLNDRSVNFLTAGYGNTTSAINAVDFKMSSGNIDAGTISLFGVA
jgi:hypothetical protein